MLGGALFATRFPLITLEHHEAALDPGLFARARRELIDAGEAGASFRSGFLLGVHSDAGSHPACLELVSGLQERLGADEFSLSFLKLVEGVPPATDEGPFCELPHLDSHPELSEATELLRLLVNLSTHPRRVAYAAVDRWQLAERGVPYRRREFQPLALPPEIETRVAVLPGRTETTVHALRFFASAIPHVGLNDPPEHFLLSFEALVSVPVTSAEGGVGSVGSAQPRDHARQVLPLS